MSRLYRFIAQLLPRRLVYWVVVRAIVHASTGKYSDTYLIDLTALDALLRWMPKYNLKP